MGVDIFVATSEESAEICSCMYMRKVSLFQRPIFLIVLWATPLRYMAIAPPARRLWEPTRDADRPFRARPRVVTARRTAVVMSAGVMSRGKAGS